MRMCKFLGAKTTIGYWLCSEMRTVFVFQLSLLCEFRTVGCGSDVFYIQTTLVWLHIFCGFRSGYHVKAIVAHCQRLLLRSF